MIFGLRCWAEKFAFILIDGDVSSCHTIKSGVKKFPADLSRPGFLNWISKELKALLTNHDVKTAMVSSLDGHRSHLNRDRTAVYSTSGISKSFLVKNSMRPVATAAGFLPGKSWLAHGIDTVSISGIHCCSRSATSKNTGNVSLPRIDSTGCRISFRPSVVIFQRCMAPSST